MLKSLAITVLLSFVAGCSTPIGAETRFHNAGFTANSKSHGPHQTLRSDSLAASILHRYELEDRFGAPA